jgi:hypothetical protein
MRQSRRANATLFQATHNIVYTPSLATLRAARSRVVSRNFFGQRARSAASGFALGLYFLASANIVYTPSLANAAGGA